MDQQRLVFIDLETGGHHSVDDVAHADGTEQFAVFADLAHDLHGGTGEFLAAMPPRKRQRMAVVEISSRKKPVKRRK